MADNNIRSSDFDVGGAAVAALPVLGGFASQLLQNNANARAAERATDYDYKKWREYVELSDPKNQVKRLRAAGINPAMAVQNGMIDSGNVSSAQNPANVPQYDFSPISQGIRDSVDLYQQRRMQDAQIDSINTSTRNQELRNRTQFQRDLMELWKMYSEVDKNSKEGQLLWQQILYTSKQVQAFDEQNSADLSLKHAQAKEHEAHADFLSAQKEYQDIINRFKPDEQKKILRNLDSQNEAILAAAYRDNEQAALAAAEKALTDAKKEGVDMDNDVLESIMQAKVDEAFAKSDESYWKSQNQSKEFNDGTILKNLPASTFDGYRDYNSRRYPSSSHNVIRRRSQRREKMVFRPE